MVYLITYDLSLPGQKYEALTDRIKELAGKDCLHIMQSVWIIKSSSSAEEILKCLNADFDLNDSMFVSELKNNCDGFLDYDYKNKIEEFFSSQGLWE